MHGRNAHDRRKRRLTRAIIALSLTGAMLGSISAFATSAGEAAPAPASSSASDTVSALAAIESSLSAQAASVDTATAAFRGELARRQARLRDFEAQLDALDQQLEVAQEAYNAANEALGDTRQQLGSTEEDLADATAAYETQVDILGDRADDIYRDGRFAAIDLLLDSKSVADLLARIKFLNTLGLRDSDLAANLQAQKDQLEQTALQLRNQQAAAEALTFELKAREVEILLRIQEREQMMATAQQEVLDLLQTEAARRQIEQAALLKDIVAGADKYGIEVVAGSPVETALAYHGIPYLWGGDTPAGFDCSGLVLYVFRQHGVTLPHYSGSQFLMGQKVIASALEPGDVVFFGSPVHHVGIYIGGGYYIHAPKTGDFVKISRLADRGDFAGGRRYLWQPRYAPIEGVTTPGNFTSPTSLVPTTTVGALLGR